MIGLHITLVALVAFAAAIPTKLPTKYDIYKNTLLQASRVVGGQDAGRRQFPHQISLLRNGRHNCGGTLIHEKWVLTAAHCKISDSDIHEIVLGQLYRNENHEDVQRIAVAQFIVHPAYPGGVQPNDIALIELATPAKLSNAVQVAAMPTDEDCDALITADLSGWGRTGWSSPTNLQWAKLLRISNEVCSESLIQLMGHDGPLDNTMICARGDGEQSESACNGDSGGPLVIYKEDKATVVGVVSWGLVPCGLDLIAPSIFTRVCSFRSFIDEHVTW